MKAAVFLGPKNIEIREVETPSHGERELLLKVDACGICGTDIPTYNQGHRKVNPPHIIGHEIAGTIVAVGAKVRGYQEGDRVCVAAEIGCGSCDFCRRGLYKFCQSSGVGVIGYFYPGGFAEYMVVPELAVCQGNPIKIPPQVPSNEAALIEPLACCINGQDPLHIGLGDTVVVMGMGAIGCMHVELAKMQGASKTIMVNASSEQRVQLAKRVAADVYLTSSKDDPIQRVLEETGGKGADVIIVACSSGSAQEQALAMAATRGRISFFGPRQPGDSVVTLDSNAILYKEAAIYGARSSSLYDMMRGIALLGSRTVDFGRLITHTLPLGELVEGIRIAAAGESLKVIINP